MRFPRKNTIKLQGDDTFFQPFLEMPIFIFEIVKRMRMVMKTASSTE